MKPTAFEYHRPASLDEALGLLAAHGGDAKPLAGGQSLVPAMNFRVAQPAVLVDLNDVPGLDGVEASAAGLRLGAMVRHRTLEHRDVVRQVAPLIAEAMPHVAHAPIRTRGTIGGSLAHADPAAELPAIMIALSATIQVRSLARSRMGTVPLTVPGVPARDFFTGLYSTVLLPGELVTSITIPPRPPGEGWAFEEVARRHGDYALAGAAAVAALDANGAVADARVALFGVHERAVLAATATRALVGRAPTPTVIAEAAEAAATVDADPASDIHATRAFRQHLTRVVVRRVLERAIARASRPSA